MQEKGCRRMSAKPKSRADVFVSLAIVVFLFAAVVALLGVQDKIALAQTEQAGLETQVAAQQQENDALRSALEKSDDPAYLQDLARDELGYVTPGEKDFYDVASK